MSSTDIIVRFLEESLSGSTAKSAERALRDLEREPGFGLQLLHIANSDAVSMPVRLAGALCFKNYVRKHWVDENGNHLLPANDVELIKKEIVPLMTTLPATLQTQIGDAIATIADSDFPAAWPDLLGDLVSRLSQEDMIVNRGVLTVAHSIFKRWRPLFRSDELFLEIKMVLDVFTEPFLKLLQLVDEKITQHEKDSQELTLLFEVLLILIKLYYDFNCQDIPEFFEDNVRTGMGIFHKFLSYENPLLDDPEETEHASVLVKVKSAIQELVQLYTTRYDDVFGPMVSEFIQITWNLLTSLSNQPKNDLLVSKSLAFLTAVCRNPSYFELFNNEDAMNNITEHIILPNVILREEDIELFEDDPIEYIRRDLEGSDTETRRRACTDFLNELKEKNESLVTAIVMNHVSKFHEQYLNNPQQSWIYKDLFVYIFTALAINGHMTHTGVSSTNSLLNVVDFFSNHVYPDLISDTVVHSIIKVDAIKFINTFRNQLSKEQMIELLPVLAQFLESNEYVVYTYAAVTIERILTIRENITSTKFVFSKKDLVGSAEVLLNNLFQLISKQGNTPEKLAENEFLMRAVFRVLQTAEESVKSSYLDFTTKLISIVAIISKNPSNPRFSHYTFEAIGTILSYSDESAILLIDSIMPTFLNILNEDIQEFIPYVFQILSYFVEKTSIVPDTIKQMSQLLLTPTAWDLKGNVPAINRLLRCLIQVSPSIYPDLIPVLGVFQRLIASKAFEVFGFELLESLMIYIEPERLRPYLKEIAVLLLKRLQSSKTDRYVRKLIVFLGTLSIKFGSSFVIQFIDQVQDGVFEQIWMSFIVKGVTTIGNPLDRKVALLGVTVMVTSSNDLFEKYPNTIAPTVSALINATLSSNINTLKSEHIDPDHMEEITTFGSTFSRLISVLEKPYDPSPEVNGNDGIKQYVSQAFRSLEPEKSKIIISQLPQDDQVKLQQLLAYQ